jgi:hypothetical protein
MLTREEAKAKAIAAGIPEGQLTEAIIALFGYDPANPTEGLEVGPVISTSEQLQDLRNLKAESDANNLPKNIASGVKVALGIAAKFGLLSLVLCAMLLAVPGCATTQAQRTVAQMERSVKALNDQHIAMEERQIAYYEINETNRIDDLYQKAVASATNPAGLIDAKVAQVVYDQRMERMAKAKEIVAKMRAQQALICLNAANAQAYGEGLKAYFQDQAISFDSIKQAQDQLIEMLNGLAKGAKK